MEGIKPYEKYKDSDIAWLGKIPQHWVEFKPKTIGYLFGGLTGKKGDDFKIEKELNISPFIPFTNIANNFIIDKYKLAYVKTFENEKQNLVKKNDLLFLMSSENFEDIGKTSLLNDEIDGLYLNSFCKGFRIEDSNFYPKFLNYIFSADVNRKRLSVEARGFTRINLKIGKVNDLAMFAPNNLTEQTAIANFLDYKTAKIDRFIFKKKQLIKLLNEQKAGIINDAVTKGLNPNAKIKSSGIEWLGDIPEHWEIVKLKYLCRIATGNKNTEDKIENGLYDFFVRSQKIAKINSYSFDGEGILTAGDGVGVGKVFHYINGKCDYHQRVYLFYEFSKRIFAKYLFYFLQKFLKNELMIYNAKSTVDSVRLPVLKEFLVTLPLFHEQQEIVSHIEKETSIINKTIATIEKEISLVQEYRTALIAEAVTGKIDVREYKVPSFEVDKEYAEMEEEVGLVAEEEINLD